MFAPGRLFQPSLIFESKSRAYLSEAQHLALSRKIGLSWKGLPSTNTLHICPIISYGERIKCCECGPWRRKESDFQLKKIENDIKGETVIRFDRNLQIFYKLGVSRPTRTTQVFINYLTIGRRQKYDSTNVWREKGSLLSFVYKFGLVARQCC